MGRSVMTIPDAVAVAYQSFGPDEDYYREIYEEDGDYDEFQTWMWNQWNYGDAEFEWDALVDGIKDAATEAWPSMEEADEWLGEVHVIAKNAHAVLGVAEYCGLVSISLAPNYDRDTYWRDDDALKQHWQEQISEKFLTLFGELTKLGTASNGESFYERSH